MKIVQVMASSAGMGGLEQHTIKLCNALAEHHEVHLIAHASYRDYLHVGIKLHNIDLSRSRFNPLLHYQLFQLIKSISPDIIHAQANKAANILSPWLNKFDCPTIATIHNIKTNIKPFLKFDKVIAVSHKIAQIFPEENKVQVIWNGTSVEYLSEMRLTPRIRPQALAIGRLVQAKGFDLLIEAWQGVDADLLIAGEGGDRPILEKKISELFLQDNVKLLGSRSDIPQLLTNSDVMIISSRNEGGPITLAEALLLKVPVFATDVGMVTDFLDQEYVCRPNDAQALKLLINKKIGLKSQLQPKFESAFEKAQLNLKFEEMCTKTEKLYYEQIQLKKS
ncbi:glycosyltransferase [Acinetobacter sp. YH12138]|uniref:glycosyltransferase n=1 Tax=Acinetobacter sp. YH12138 TaxID=2601122 RepID=UPI0015D28D87|nr:glycosyltransferase [Acinetobacter sp. YH12138]QOW50613.1 glycosyltransferase [Acinetobacter sp. YH12138]